MSTLKLNGSSSGTAQVTVAAAAGTPTITLPTASIDFSTAGTDGQFLKTNGSGTLSFATVSTGAALSNDGNNRVVTADGSGGLNGEANCLYDGDTLFLGGETSHVENSNCVAPSNSTKWGYTAQKTSTSGGNAIFGVFNGSDAYIGGITQINTTDQTQIAYATSGSDSRLKKNIETWTEDTLSKFKAIEPKKFNFNLESDSADKHKGFIAQDLLASFPEAYPVNSMNDRYYFNPGGMVVYLMKALQEASTKIETLETKVAALEAG